MLRPKHSEFVDEGVWSSSRDILIKQFLGYLVIITEDSREGSQEDANQLPELLDEPLGAGCQNPVGLRYKEHRANYWESPWSRRKV